METEILRIDAKDPDRDLLKKAGNIIKDGGIVAFPTETVYGLGGNALDPGASKKIYAAKGRPSDNPLIVHIADTESLYKIVRDVPEGARRLMELYWPGPLTMIFRKKDCVPYETTGGLDTVAVRMPSNVTARMLIEESGGYVAAPSANLSGRPSPTLASHVIEDLSGKIDMIIDGGGADIGLESTIVDFTVSPPVILRPGYISLEMIAEEIPDIRENRGQVGDDEIPKAPGMKYRHYAPRAPLYIVEGEREDTASKIGMLVSENTKAGKLCGIICAGENRDLYNEGYIRVPGISTDEDEIARNIYAILRDMDGEGVDVIYSEAFDTPRLGDAIMNRIIKAAGHNIIKAK